MHLRIMAELLYLQFVEVQPLTKLKLWRKKIHVLLAVSEINGCKRRVDTHKLTNGRIMKCSDLLNLICLLIGSEVILG